jgi:ribosome recycling factor
MNKVLELLASELVSFKAGRATPAMVEKIMVEVYGTKMPLVELATTSIPETDQILITPFDQTIIKEIEKALSMDRGLGLFPVVDGNIIRLKIPSLTEEKRKELIKVLHQKLEAARVMIRQVRAEKMAEIRRAFEAKEVHEDQRRQMGEELQKLTDEMTEKAEEMGKTKEQELMQI